MTNGWSFNAIDFHKDDRAELLRCKILMASIQALREEMREKSATILYPVFEKLNDELLKNLAINVIDDKNAEWRKFFSDAQVRINKAVVKAKTLALKMDASTIKKLESMTWEDFIRLGDDSEK